LKLFGWRENLMALHIENPEADELARQLAERTGEPLEDAVVRALRHEIAREEEVARVLERVREISRRFQALPILDPRTPDEIIGYNEYGVPE
jgi:antitoxin VapB